MGRFIIVVLDSFGVGAMDDCRLERPQDISANTYRSVLTASPDLALPTLERLGIANAAHLETSDIKFSEWANYGVANLKHFGCDTFYGHQELMGTDPKKPIEQPFSQNITLIEQTLSEHGYYVERYGEGHQILIVNHCLSIGDNLEADLGQVYNVIGSFDLIRYEDLLTVGRLVRSIVKIPRVITFGGSNVTLDEIKNAYRSTGEFAGVSAPKSGVYRQGYLVQHMGYGIDASVQLPTIIGQEIPVILIGKVADIVANPYGRSIMAVDTTLVMQTLVEQIKAHQTAFICANVQETDLAGHAEDPLLYLKKLTIADHYLEQIIQLMAPEDILIVTADHGNDPKIGHAHHTREKVPVLVYKANLTAVTLGTRNSLADMGQTAAAYFGYQLPENGVSFLDQLTTPHFRFEGQPLMALV